MSQITSSAARTMTTARSTQPAAELEDEVAWVVVVTGWVVEVVVAWGWVVVVGASVVEVVVAVVGGTVVVVVVVVAGAEVVVVPVFPVFPCAAAPPADTPTAKRTAANTANSPPSVRVRRNMVAQPRDRAPTKRGSYASRVGTGVEAFYLVGTLSSPSGLVRHRFAPCDHAPWGKAVQRVQGAATRDDAGV
jgi:hypothetical protein